MQWLNTLLDKLSEFLAHCKGLLPLLGILLILANLILQFLPPGWLAQSNLLLHIGVILAILGMMLAW
ncbi:MAG: hypothetical protein C0393_03160, partial [Anaerolinea sp.]|nr:hypothetical protein [Anaerolinea sp.]